MNRLTACCAALACLPGLAPAQTYPSKPVRLVVGFNAGGSADTSARAVARRMADAMKATLVIENRGGAGGSYAAQIVADANPDGHTLFWGTVGALTVSPALGMKLPYDTERDFAPVGRTITFANALVVRPDFPAGSLAELTALIRERPGHYNYATQGVGSAGHLSGELWRSLAGIRLNPIGYKGAAEIVTSLVGGDVQIAFMSTTAARNLGTGRIKPIAVTGARRDTALPGVPTFAEAGIAGYDATFWYGLLTPARTPAAVIDRLGRELRAALADAEVVRLLEVQGLVAAPSSPQEFRDLIRADLAKWKKVIGPGRAG